MHDSLKVGFFGTVILKKSRRMHGSELVSVRSARIRKNNSGEKILAHHEKSLANADVVVFEIIFMKLRNVFLCDHFQFVQKLLN